MHISQDSVDTRNPAAVSIHANRNRALSPVLIGLLLVVIGAAFALAVLGPRALNPFDVSWLTGDPATGYLGWRFFRNQETFTFPFGYANDLGYPIGVRIAYQDAIPLAAALFWPFRHYLSDNFQYFGLLFLLNCILQLCFGYLISMRLSKNDRLIGLTGGIIFMMAPPFIWRALGHFAISSHWLILAALYLFLTAPRTISLSQAAKYTALSFIAGCISPYLNLMVLMFLSAALGYSVFSSNTRKEAVQGIAYAACAIGACFVASLSGQLLIGVLVIGDPSSYNGFGYGYYSMNLLAPINPMDFGSLFLKSLPTATAGQYEGYNYLGLGLIILSIASLARRPSVVRDLLTRRAFLGWIVFAVSLLLALSLKATIGGRVLYDISLPTEIQNALGIFRASGRLFWPGFYLMVTCIIAASLMAFGRGAVVALLIAGLLQFADMHKFRTSIYNSWQNSSAQAFTDEPVWQGVAQANRHLVVMPPWQCGPDASPGGQEGFWTFGKLAANNKMTINSFYVSRMSNKQSEYFCAQQISDVQKEGLQKDTAYVFSSPATAISLDSNDQFCRMANGVVLCSHDEKRAGIDSSVFQNIPTAPVNQQIEFAADKNTTGQFVGVGWATPEPWGRWSAANESTLAFRIAQQTSSVRLRLSVLTFAPPDHPQHVKLALNGQQVAEWIFTDQNEKELSVVVPAELIASKGYAFLKFSLPDAASPKSLGISADARQLAIGLKSLSITYE